MTYWLALNNFPSQDFHSERAVSCITSDLIRGGSKNGIQAEIQSVIQVSWLLQQTRNATGATATFRSIWDTYRTSEGKQSTGRTL